jgi:hypothetical protein
MMLPMAEMVGWLRKGVGELVRQGGLQLMELLMQEEVRELVGERSQQQAARPANRWGSGQGYCVVMGQKVPMKRPRVRTVEDKEVQLATNRFQSSENWKRSRYLRKQLSRRGRRRRVGMPGVVTFNGTSDIPSVAPRRSGVLYLKGSAPQ